MYIYRIWVRPRSRAHSPGFRSGPTPHPLPGFLPKPKPNGRKPPGPCDCIARAIPSSMPGTTPKTLRHPGCYPKVATAGFTTLKGEVVNFDVYKVILPTGRGVDHDLPPNTRHKPSAP